MPGAALFTVASAAVYGVRSALQAEYAGRPQRITEVCVCVCTSDAITAQSWLACCVPLLSTYAPAFLPCPCPSLQLRIGGVIRRDREPRHPDFPQHPAFPASRVGKAAVRIAASPELRDEVVRLELDADDQGPGPWATC